MKKLSENTIKRIEGRKYRVFEKTESGKVVYEIGRNRGYAHDYIGTFRSEEAIIKFLDKEDKLYKETYTEEDWEY